MRTLDQFVNIEDEVRLPPDPRPPAYAGPYVYALTISHNKAIDSTCNRVYGFIIDNLPNCHFTFVKEISKNGKHHIHGIANFMYRPTFEQIRDSKGPYQGVHIRYDRLATLQDQAFFWLYMQKTHPKQQEIVPQGSLPPTKKSCIPRESLVAINLLPGIFRKLGL